MKSYRRPVFLLTIALCGIIYLSIPLRSLSATLAPPANDNFANAQVISGTTGATTGTNVEATGETGEPNHASSSFPMNSIWYVWTAPANVSMRFSTAGSSLSTVTMAVYTGTAVNALSVVNTNAISPGILRSSVIFMASTGTTYYIAIDGLDTTIGGISLSWAVNRSSSSRQFNFDGDNASDFSIFRPGTGVWYTRQSNNGLLSAQQWGLSSDLLVPEDYDGDGKTDAAVWRPTQSTFYILRSFNNTVITRQWGVAGDVPVQGDFDGNEIADFSVWRPGDGTFYVLRNNGQMIARQWGTSTDTPAPGDYDGDGKTDFAVRRTSGADAGTFYILRSSSNSLLAMSWGVGTDKVVPGDYDGDGRSDVAVYRESVRTFYVLRSSDGLLLSQQWGTAGDLTTPGDYDGDGRTDFAIWRPGDGAFYVHSSLTSTLVAQPWGLNGDRPVANSFVR